jgi:hypothetical protein
MKSSWFSIVMAVCTAAWFGVIVPGHQRGMVLVGGAERQAAAQSCCAMDAPKAADADDASTAACHEKSPEKSSAKKPGGKQKSDPFRVKNCAVCDVAAVVDVPPPVSFVPVPDEPFARFRPIASDVSALELPFLTVPFKRGPPVTQTFRTI